MRRKTITIDQIKDEAASWPPGAVILTASQGGFLGPAIRIFQSLLSGMPTRRSHVLFYAGIESGRPVGISQDWRIKVRPISDYVGSRITVAWDPGHSREAREKLLEAAREALGRKYDWPGIIGQALASVTRIKWFRRAFHAPWRTYCSEFVVLLVRRYLNDGFVGNVESCQANPDEIDVWVRTRWTCKDYELVA